MRRFLRRLGRTLKRHLDVCWIVLLWGNVDFVERQGEEEEERVRLTSRKVGGGNKKCCS
jgi:hypothetical protein